MEPQKTSKKPFIIGAIVVALVAVAAFAAFGQRPGRDLGFCFNFDRNTQYGDREVANPSNVGITMPDKITYYYEVNYLQKALQAEGFYVDPYETTGGNVYAGAFFGPSTQSAVKQFQAKYGFSETGQVDPIVSEKLRELYGCVAEAPTATSTAPTASSTE